MFGCESFSYLRSYNNNKLEFRSITCTFLGKVLDIQDISAFKLVVVYIARHATFNELVFLFAQISQKHVPDTNSRVTNVLPIVTSFVPTQQLCSTSLSPNFAREFSPSTPDMSTSICILVSASYVSHVLRTEPIFDDLSLSSNY